MHFALDDQIISQPTTIQAVLSRPLSVRLDLQRPLYFVGIGTSWHACQVAASWIVSLTQGHVRPFVTNAHDFALNQPVPAEAQVVVVSHRGTKLYPHAALAKAHLAGATTIAIVGEAAPDQAADHVLRTCPDERSGTHTVSYLSSLALLGKLIAQSIGPAAAEFFAALEQVPAAISSILDSPAPQAQAQLLAGREPILVVGSGLDAITAAEAALKLKEGAYQWAEGFALENALHGPVAAFRAGMGALTITPAHNDGGRMQTLRAVLTSIGVISITCGSQDEDLIIPSVHALVRPLVSIVPFQRLTAELARINHSNPDLIHGDVDPWSTAMALLTL